MNDRWVSLDVSFQRGESAAFPENLSS
jgi:hypothetical protein